MDRSNTNNYWHQPDVNSTIKSHLKLPVNTQITSQCNSVPDYSDVTSNSLKRPYSGPDRLLSPIKKRPFIAQPPPCSSVEHSDDDDDDDDDDGDNNSISMNSSNNTADKSAATKRDDSRRRAAHTAAEQKRRNAIRKGYDALQALVPNSHLLDPISSQKVSKAAILKRSTDYLLQLNKEKQQLSNELEAKRKDTICLRTVQKTYEDILEMNMTSAKNASANINDEHKFKIFQNIADTIFTSFDQAMQSGQVTNFTQFTSTMIRWVEDSCRPSDIGEIIRRVVTNSKS